MSAVLFLIETFCKEAEALLAEKNQAALVLALNSAFNTQSNRLAISKLS